LESGHWTYECKGERPYQARPSRTQQLMKPIVPKRQAPIRVEKREGLADKILAEKQAQRARSRSRSRSSSRSRDRNSRSPSPRNRY
jgi:hypothetical protein